MELKNKAKIFSKYIFLENKASLEASYCVNYRIGKEEEAYMTGEKWIKPCGKDLNVHKISEKYAKEIGSCC